ncbi:hypothetical protein BGZ67_010293, partial [Mortierella alpina]
PVVVTTDSDHLSRGARIVLRKDPKLHTKYTANYNIIKAMDSASLGPSEIIHGYYAAGLDESELEHQTEDDDDASDNDSNSSGSSGSQSTVEDAESAAA